MMIVSVSVKGDCLFANSWFRVPAVCGLRTKKLGQAEREGEIFGRSV